MAVGAVADEGCYEAWVSGKRLELLVRGKREMAGKGKGKTHEGELHSAAEAGCCCFMVVGPP